MAAPELEQLWQDPRHWTAGVIYHCAADPRVIVPRRWRWGGWTLNFAHPSAWLVLLAAVAVLVGPLLIVAATSRLTLATVLAVLVPSILLVCFAAAWESERGR
jgi:hypothetical protein